MRGFPSDADGYAGSLSCTREVSAVTGACMAIRRDLLRRARRLRRALRDALPGRRPLPAPRSAGRRILFTPRAVAASRRERHARRALRPPRPRAPPRRAGARRSSAATRTTTRALARRGRLPTAARRVNVVFVNYHDFTSNSAVHICQPRERAHRGAATSCAVARPRRSGRRSRCSASTAFQALDFRTRSDRRAALSGRRAASLVHAWTPREVVRELTEELSAALRLPVRRPPRGQRGRDHRRPPRPERSSELRGRRRRLDGVDLRRRSSHPRRMRRFLAGAAGITVIIDRLLEFQPDGVPAEVVWPAFEPELFTRRPGRARSCAARLGIARRTRR